MSFAHARRAIAGAAKRQRCGTRWPFVPRRGEAVLEYVGEHDGATDAEIVRALRLPSRAAAAGVCRRLEAAGLIERRKVGRVVRNYRRAVERAAAVASEPARASTEVLAGDDTLGGGIVFELDRPPLSSLAKPGVASLRIWLPGAGDRPAAEGILGLAFDGTCLRIQAVVHGPDLRVRSLAEVAKFIREAPKRWGADAHIVPIESSAERHDALPTVAVEPARDRARKGAFASGPARIRWWWESSTPAQSGRPTGANP
jgi:hypothetical protein